MFWKVDRFGKKELINGKPRATCNITCDLLVSKLLGQYSREQRAQEARARELKELEERIKKEKEDAELKALKEELAQHELFLEGKVKMVSELLSKLKPDDKEAVSRTFLAMSSSSECCVAIRQFKCLPVIVGLIFGDGCSSEIREQALRALHNVVLHGAENSQGRVEAMVYKLIEQVLKYCNQLETVAKNPADEADATPMTVTQSVALLMKFSFNKEYRRSMCEFGALPALIKLIQIDHFSCNGNIENLPAESVAIRRYAATALTNLIYRDSSNKSLLASFDTFMRILVAQLQSPNEDLLQVTASVLRNLSWQADASIKKLLYDINSITALMKTALRIQKESTLKAVLSALWNLSAHSNLNKVDICNVDGAIEYLVKMLNYQSPSGSNTIVENVGGIFRNISSLIAVRDDYRAIIRDYNCLYVLLHQLSSSSLTIVSNACGTLWNLSARCAEDQSTLLALGAIETLSALVVTHSQHKPISAACSAALKNLQNARLDANVVVDEDRNDGSFLVRKRRLLEREIKARLRAASESGAAQADVTCPEHSFSGQNLANRRIMDFAHPLHGDPKSLIDDPRAVATVTRVNSNSVRFNFTNDNDDKKKVGNGAAAFGQQTDANKENAIHCNFTKLKSILSKSADKKAQLPAAHDTKQIKDGGGQGGRTSNGLRKGEGLYSGGLLREDYTNVDQNQCNDQEIKFPEQASIGLERSEMMVADLLNQCIVLSMQNMKDSVKEQSDLERLTAENLEAGYISAENERLTPKQRRNKPKESDDAENQSAQLSNAVRKTTPKKGRRVAEKDRVMTQSLSKEDFEEIVKNKPKINTSPKLSMKNANSDESGGTQSDGENYTKGVKLIARAKSAIPIKNKLPTTKSPGSVKITSATEPSAVSLQRQNTFSKYETSAIPVRKNSFKNPNLTSESDLMISKNNGGDNSSTLQLGFLSRVKLPSPKGVRMPNGMAEKPVDFALNGTVSKGTAQVTKCAPIMRTGCALVRRESSLKAHNRVAYGK